jgi:hypothetical protein
MVFLGSRGKFDQITLVRLDPQAPTEDARGLTEQNIFTGDLEASNVFTSNVGIANLFPHHHFAVGSNAWINDDGVVTMAVKKRALFEQARVSTQMSVNADTPTHIFQVNDTNRVFVDNLGADLFNVEGNVVCENLRVTQGMEMSGDITTTGNVTASRIIFDQGLEFGSNIIIDDVGDPVLGITGNVDVTDGDLTVFGNVRVFGNVDIRDFSTYSQQINLELSNAIVVIGEGNDLGTLDTGVVFRQTPSNVFVGYLPATERVHVGRTLAGPGDDEIVVADANVDLYVHGNVVTDHNVGVANANPQHNLSVGSNLWAHDTGSNVLFVRGNAYFERTTFGSGFNIGSNVVVDDSASNVFSVDGRAAFTTLFATERVGIANTNPIHTLCIGSNIHMHETGANLAVFHGNVVSDRFMATQRVGIQQYNPDESLHVGGNVRLGGRAGVDANQENYIKSTGGIVVHADDAGSDNTNNSLLLKSGAVAGNVTTVELSSGATDATKQFFKVKTRNTERICVDSAGRVGIANVNPASTLTVGGGVQVLGSNTLDVGEVWSTNKTTLRSLVSPSLGETYLQSRVLAGKGFNLTVSSGATQGTPKLTVLETGKVGIGTTQPQPRGLQVTGNVFVNNQVTANNGFSHETVPMTVTHPTFVNTPDFMEPVIQLCRDASTSSVNTFGARAVLALGKHGQVEAGKSKTRLDFGLAHTDYNTANVIMTLLSSGLVGIGTHTPVSKLEVRATGSAAASPRTNGILVYNANDEDNEDAVVCMEVNDRGGDAFGSYKITSGDTVGWSAGSSFSQGSKFKIANHAGDLNTNTRLVIDSTGRVGINVNDPEYKLDVDGQVRIGNKLLFRGLAADIDDTSFIEERQLTDTITELLLFKANDSAGGADQIRHVAARHAFNVYNKAIDFPDDTDGALTQQQISDIVKQDGTDIPGVYDATPVMSIEKERRVLINSVEQNLGTNTRLYVDGNVQLKQGSQFDTDNLQILTESTGLNVLRAREQSDVVLRFGEIGTFERVRFTSTGDVGIGTNAPNKLLHLYDSTTQDVVLLNLESPAGASASKYTGLQLTTDSGYGAFLKAQKGSTSNSVVLGYVDNGTQVDGLYVGEDGHVGVGTSAPTANLHVYDSNLLIEHTTSNAVLDLKTSSATSNIYANSADDDLYLYPAGGNVVVQGSLTVQQDIDFGGRIEFGDAVGIKITEPQAPLHVNGGTIINSDAVARKTYSNTFSVNDQLDKTVILTFDKGAFYAKIHAMLRYAPNGKYLSSMILEAHGGHSDNTQTSDIPIAIGTQNIFGGQNPYPWSRIVDTTATTISLDPHVAFPQSGADVLAYYYDFFIELTTASGGKLLNIKRDTETKVSFDY